MKRFMLFASLALTAMIFAGCEDPQAASAVQEDPKLEVATCSADLDCDEGLVCIDGACAEEAPVPETCEPACGDKACGDDGCGGSCGECGEGATCGETNQCVCPEGTSMDEAGACVAPPDPVVCQPGFVIKDGQCVLGFPLVQFCKPGFVMKDGKCVLMPIFWQLIPCKANEIRNAEGKCMPIIIFKPLPLDLNFSLIK